MCEKMEQKISINTDIKVSRDTILLILKMLYTYSYLIKVYNNRLISFIEL